MNIYPWKRFSGHHVVLSIYSTAKEIITYTVLLVLQPRILTNEEVSHPREAQLRAKSIVRKNFPLSKALLSSVKKQSSVL